jgi:hypothetical protein
VLFLSFLPKEKLLPQDEFGVFHLPGTEFVQLPFDKATILELAEKLCGNSLTDSSAAWESFSEKACRTLLHQKIDVIKHKQDLAFINKVSLGLRLAVENVINYPEQRCETLQYFNERYTAMLAYVENPQIIEIIELASIVQNSDDTFLNIVSKLVKDLKLISDTNNKENFTDLRATIFRIQDTVSELEKLQPN